MYTAVTARRDLILYGRKIAEQGLVVGPGGNTSVRAGEIVYMKASGSAFEDATEKDYIGIDTKTRKLVDGKGKPTCEILMHLLCYEARQDICAVCHTHPPFATAIANAGETIPPMNPDFVALIGAELPRIDYVVPASKELAEKVAEAIATHDAVLLTNHGLVTVGGNMREAYFKNLIVEDSAKSYIAGKILGKLSTLKPEQVREISTLHAERYRKEILKRYG